MTNEQAQAYARALLREQQAYEAAGDEDGVKAVSAELRRLADSTRPRGHRPVTR